MYTDLPDAASEDGGKVRELLLRSKVKVKCRQNLITSKFHQNTYSYQVTSISLQ